MPYDWPMVATGESVRRVRGRLARVAVVVVSAAMVCAGAGCSKAGGSALAARAGEPPVPTSTGSSAGSSAGSSTASSEPTTPAARTVPTSSEAPLLVGRRVTAARAGLSFEVPAGWQALDPSAAMSAGAAALPDAAKELAASSGLSVDEYLQRIGTAIEVMVMGRPVRGSADNISVIPTPLTQLPTADDLRSQLEAVGASVTRVDRTTTPIGPAIVVASRLPIGTFTTHTRSVAVRHGGHVTYLTVTATTRSRADSLLRDMLTSLRRV
jgi:hypothetical protein